MKKQNQIAFVHCDGGKNSEKLFEFDESVTSCAEALEKHPDGNRGCKQGCVGLGDCVEACPFDAIHINDYGVAEVDREKCRHCKLCIKACPQNIIDSVPVYDIHLTVAVACSNTDKGGVARKVCEASCIGCGLCEKNCPVDAIKVIDNVAVLDQEKCIQCSACQQVCPRSCIVDSEGMFAEKQLRK